MATVPTSAGGFAGGRELRGLLAGVLLLCAPAILGTIGLAGLTGLGMAGGVALSPGLIADLIGESAVAFFMMGTYGPLLLIGAVPLALMITRRSGHRSRPSAIGWGGIGVALLAALVFHSWLTFVADLP